MNSQLAITTSLRGLGHVAGRDGRTQGEAGQFGEGQREAGGEEIKKVRHAGL